MKSVKNLESVKTQLFAQNNNCKLSIVNGGGGIVSGVFCLAPGSRTKYIADNFKA